MHVKSILSVLDVSECQKKSKVNMLLFNRKPASAGLLLLCNLFFVSASAAEDKPLATIDDLRGAARDTVETCQQDLEKYCSDVTPGEGRLFSCMHSHADKLSDPCKQALGLWELPDLEPRLIGATRYPTLEERELGEANLDADGDKILWDHPLPFLAQDVIDLGFDLPLPFGIAIIPGWVQQDLILDQLAIAVNDGPKTDIDFVDFGTPQVQNTTMQLKLDAWVFPFMNVYATVGVLDGKGAIPIKIEGQDLFPAVCNVSPNLPICVRTFSEVANIDYTGENVAVGVNLAMGWKEYFVTLPITYAWTDVNIIDTTVTALHISPRFGMTSTTANGGLLSAFVGATYLDAEVDLAGTVAFDTPGGPGGDITTVDFEINQRNKDKWNYVLGFNWDISKKWSVMLESGFGGSRQNFISGITYRL